MVLPDSVLLALSHHALQVPLAVEELLGCFQLLLPENSMTFWNSALNGGDYATELATRHVNQRVSG